MRHIKIFEDYNVIKDIELFLQDNLAYVFRWLWSIS